MKNSIPVLIVSTLSIIMLIAVGCSNKNVTDVSPFEAEIINETDAFQFQVTDAANVTTQLNYSWENTGEQATIDHSTSTTAGSASIVLLDADDVQVYSSSLVASATETSSVGAPGTWTVRVSLVNFSGTVNFRVEKL
jgi:uncharacterized lipoprotein NlpE involved in copper resistance